MINIGPLKEPSDIVDLMLECHERIRSFAGLACRLARADGASHDEIRDAAGRVSRYFSEALPLHVADEEQSVIPRLAGKSPQLDAALQEMHGDHLDHEAKLQSLLETCNTLKASPEMLDDLRETLLDTASRLETAFATHLMQEEELIFPAIRSLVTQEQQAMMLTELRARRTSKQPE
jgi:iron-sulfur cluster repair protein YtfE (RIC family)